MNNLLNKLLLPFILATALVVRLWDYTALALWHDEAFSALLIRMPFSEMMQRIALDVHPPFYYWLLRVWASVFGHSLESLRGFSVFFGVATVWLLYVLVREIFKDYPADEGKKLAWGAAALLAVNAFHIQYSLEARMYTLGTFLIVLGTWVMLKALRTNRWPWWLAFAILTSASALTHYFLLFSLAAQGLFILIWWLKKYRPVLARQNLKWAASFILAGVLSSWWLPTFWRQFSQVEQNYWIPEMERWSVPATIWKILISGWQGIANNILIVASVAFVFLLLVYLWRYRKLDKILLVLMGFVPFVLAILISLRTALYLDRYFIFAAVFIVAFIALALASIKWQRLGSGLLILLILASVIFFADRWQQLDVKNHPGMRATSEYLFGNYQPSDKIVVASTFIYFSYKYYYQQWGAANPPAYPLLYLKGITQTEQLPHFSGTALLNDGDFIGDLKTYGQSGETIWLLWTTGFGGSKPEVPANWLQIEEQKIPDVFLYRGDIYLTRYSVN